MSSAVGKSIKLFLADGSPTGIITAEIMNWTGHVVSAPRSRLADLLARSEVNKTGVYFLTGDLVDGDFIQAVYVGETDNIKARLLQHSKDGTKDFWERVCIVTSKDQNLTKSHVKYIESRLIGIIQKSGLAKLANSNCPIYENLPEADIADMEFFTNQVRMILPVLGMNFLREPPVVRASQGATAHGTPSTASPAFELRSRKHEIVAKAQEVDGEFVVLSGSDCRPSWEGVETNYVQIFNTLFETGKIQRLEGGLKARFTEDVAFASPSAAAAVVLGRSANGRLEWRVENAATTYGEWQNSQLPLESGARN